MHLEHNARGAFLEKHQLLQLAKELDGWQAAASCPAGEVV